MSAVTLEHFRRVIGYHPWHFWGLADTLLIPVKSACNQIVTKYPWQASDAAGRESIQNAIDTAEQRLFEYLGYSVYPRYRTVEVPWPPYADITQRRISSIGADARRLPVSLREGKLIAVGVEKLTSVGNTNITFSDKDTDGLKETFEATIATTETDSSKIRVYFTTGDRYGDTDLSERWQIRPLELSIAAGVLTIRGNSWQVVRPILYERANAINNPLDPGDSSLFATAVSVYISATNPDGTTVDDAQATLLWETAPCTGWWCCTPTISFTPTNSAHDPAAVGKAIARVGIRDSSLGLVLPAQALLNSSTGIWYDSGYESWQQPDRVIIRYYAGDSLEKGEVQKKWQTIVTRLAIAELAGRICACNEANREIYHWQFDLSRAAGANDEQYQVSSRDLDNPFGTRRGQVYAWKQVNNLRIQQGILV